LIIEVLVKPKSKESTLEKSGDFYIAKIKSIPHKGEANEELIGLIAEEFGVLKRNVSIKTGGRGKRKLVEIRD